MDGEEKTKGKGKGGNGPRSEEARGKCGRGCHDAGDKRANKQGGDKLSLPHPLLNPVLSSRPRSAPPCPLH
eukprot:scaffold8159_cov109-Isochrysis_galbana.AAC.3